MSSVPSGIVDVFVWNCVGINTSSVHPTPLSVGPSLMFRIQGGDEITCYWYNVPEVPNVMYFTDYGHAIHGTYWHNNFGVPMSHGCINLPLDVSDWMYQWLSVGARVEIMP